MRVTRDARGWLETPARRPVMTLLTFLLLAAAAGCGSQRTEQASVTPTSEGESSTQATVAATATAPELAARPTARRRAGTIHLITLSDRRCIRFEPQWTSVRLGQSITWHSELKTPMTVYVSPGVFSRESFLVRPGATVSTGPARTAGRYSFWTEPAACREAPRGVLLAGPGVRVQDNFYASAPGVR